MEIYKTIYARAEEKGIKIEKSPQHKLDADYIGSGRRNVQFPGSRRIYSYSGTLFDIAIRLGLLSNEEIRQHYLDSGKFIVCPRCNAIGDKDFIATIGHCGNC